MTDVNVPVTPSAWPRPLPKVRVVGPNPAMDRVQVVDTLKPGAVHRATEVAARAGGKSFIVARTLRRRGVGVAMYGFLGGVIVDLAAAECRALGIDDRHTRVKESTRITPVIVEASTGRSTVINEPGPMIQPVEDAVFRESLIADIRAGDVIVCTGSLPPGVDTGLYATIAREAAARGAYVAVDASGDSLRLALEAAPWLVKCNRAEFTTVHRLAPDADDAEVVAAMSAQVGRGSALVVVTMGAASFLAATQDGIWRVGVPVTDVVNATGSGDTFLGCFVAAAVRGDGFADALRDATAGGVVNAGQLEAGLQPDAELEPFRSQVTITVEPAVVGVP
jgi:1-phosphofructokinase family hexose kinase